jgi:hypothetical protein
MIALRAEAIESQESLFFSDPFFRISLPSVLLPRKLGDTVGLSMK